MMMPPITYQEALTQRAFAEQHSDPDEYWKAATLFEALGFDLAAARCADRARRYQGQQMIPISISISEAVAL